MDHYIKMKDTLPGLDILSALEIVSTELIFPWDDSMWLVDFLLCLPNHQQSNRFQDWKMSEQSKSRKSEIVFQFPLYMFKSYMNQ
mgnify:CR=1 FL=1